MDYTHTIYKDKSGRYFVKTPDDVMFEMLVRFVQEIVVLDDLTEIGGFSIDTFPHKINVK